MTSSPTRSQRLIAEFIGTFALVFVGAGSIVANDLHNGAVTHVGISLCFGLIVAAMIYSIGNVSGAHINPAVSIALWVSKRFPGRDVVPYIVVQCLGALAASVLIRMTMGDHKTLGGTHPAASWQQAFAMEVVITFMLVFVILNVTAQRQQSTWLAGIVIGGTVALAALFAGPICGASMNPARSLGPAVISGQLSDLWAYIVAPVLGAVLAVSGCRRVQGKPCCSGSCEPELVSLDG